MVVWRRLGHFLALIGNVTRVNLHCFPWVEEVAMGVIEMERVMATTQNLSTLMIFNTYCSLFLLRKPSFYLYI
jgi:hypothetical protein